MGRPVKKITTIGRQKKADYLLKEANNYYRQASELTTLGFHNSSREHLMHSLRCVVKAINIQLNIQLYGE